VHYKLLDNDDIVDGDDVATVMVVTGCIGTLHKLFSRIHEVVSTSTPSNMVHGSPSRDQFAPKHHLDRFSCFA